MKQGLLLFFIILVACSQHKEKCAAVDLTATLKGQWISIDYYNALLKCKSLHQVEQNAFSILGFYYNPLDKNFQKMGLGYSDRNMIANEGIDGFTSISNFVLYLKTNEIVLKEGDLKIRGEEVLEPVISFDISGKDTILVFNYSVNGKKITKSYVKVGLDTSEQDITSSFNQFIYQNTIAGAYLEPKKNDTLIFDTKGNLKWANTNYYYSLSTFLPLAALMNDAGDYLTTRLKDEEPRTSYYIWSIQEGKLILIDLLKDGEKTEFNKIK